MRVLRRLVHVLVIVITLIIGVTAAVIIVAETAWFKNLLRAYIVREANQYLNGQVSIGRLGGNLLFGVELENIGISMDGSQVVAVKDLGLEYSVFELFSKGLSVNSIRLNQPVLYLRREGDTWSISRLVKDQQQEANRTGPARPIAVDAIGVSDGSIDIEGPVGTGGVDVPKRIDHLDAELAFKYEPVRYSIEITHVSFRGSDPAIALNALSGGVAVRNDTVYVDKLALRTAESSVSVDGAVQQYLTDPTFNVQVSSDKLSVPEIARLVPSLAGVRLQPAFDVKVDGPMKHLAVEANVRSSAGQAIARLVASVVAPGQSVSGDLSIRHLDISQILNNTAEKSDITAAAAVDVHSESFSNLDSLRGTVKLTAPRVAAAGYAVDQVRASARLEGRKVALEGGASAYGAGLSVAGTVNVPRAAQGQSAPPVTYDVHGQVKRIDLQRFPRALGLPAAETNVNAEYHLSGAGSSSVNGEARFGDSTLPGARVADGTTAGFSLNGKDIEYRADAAVSNVDLQKLGDAFKVDALASDRYKSDLNAHVTASGRGTTLEGLDLTASGAISDSTLLGGRVPELTFDATVAQNTAHVKARGTFEGFDPEAATGNAAAKGEVAGSVDADATVANVSGGFNLDALSASAKLTLQPSTVGGVAIDHGALDASYDHGSAEIRTLELAGADGNVRASGRVAINESDQSNLTFHLDTPGLDRIGKLIDKPLSGIANVDGTLTGNRSELQVSGDLVGGDLTYGENGALSLKSTFSIRLPEFKPADAAVSATTSGTFVTLGGQHINELTARTDYASQQLDFDATAKQPQRSASVAGSLRLLPDREEVRLQRFTVETAPVTWELAPAAQPVVDYGGNAVTVHDLRLASGDQQIAADGRFGLPGQSLVVTLNNVDLAGVDALLLRPPQFSGRLSASATLGGTKEFPQVQADFHVEQGGFRDFRYDTLSSTVEYTGSGINLDARLQQNPSTWIEAKGYVPAAALGGGSPNADHGAPAAADRFDLHMNSSPIDLGVVQGFTTALTRVKGTVQATLDVTGPADDPEPNGAIVLQQGAFTVPATGVSYSNLDGRVEVQQDRVHLDQIALVDDRQKPLSISGDLAVRERQVGAFNVNVKSDDFKLLGNKMGNVRIKTNVNVSGDLSQPRVDGDLGVTTGTINLDPIMAVVGESAYSTQQVQYTTGSASAAGQGQTAPPSLFDALQMNLHLTVPDDLVIKANDLRIGADSPIGLGALIVTLGGDVTLDKQPYDSPRLYGPIKTIRGTYNFQGRRFTILRDGTVQFEGLDPIDPALDIRTQRLIQGVQANVNVEGTLSKPRIVLSSSPPLEQADILALIVFNQPINQLGEGQQISLAQRAGSLAEGTVAGQLAESLGNALNLQTFELQMAPESGSTAELTVGQQVSQNLYVKLQQGLGGVSTTNFILEYELTEWMRLQTNVYQGSTTQQALFQRIQGSGFDLLFTFSY